jgi:hypothetical protein
VQLLVLVLECGPYCSLFHCLDVGLKSLKHKKYIEAAYIGIL